MSALYYLRKHAAGAALPARRAKRPEPTGPIVIDRDQLPLTGWIQIVEVGEENMYFRKRGTGPLYCVKLDA